MIRTEVGEVEQMKGLRRMLREGLIRTERNLKYAGGPSSRRDSRKNIRRWRKEALDFRG